MQSSYWAMSLAQSWLGSVVHAAPAWMLEAAGIGSGGLAGRMRAAGLAVVYARAFRAWLEDDSADLGKTMAALDRGLAQAERWASVLPGVVSQGLAARPTGRRALAAREDGFLLHGHRSDRLRNL